MWVGENFLCLRKGDFLFVFFDPHPMLSCSAQPHNHLQARLSCSLYNADSRRMYSTFCVTFTFLPFVAILLLMSGEPSRRKRWQ